MGLITYLCGVITQLLRTTDIQVTPLVKRDASCQSQDVWLVPSPKTHGNECTSGWFSIPYLHWSSWNPKADFWVTLFWWNFLTCSISDMAVNIIPTSLKDTFTNFHIPQNVTWLWSQHTLLSKTSNQGFEACSKKKTLPKNQNGNKKSQCSIGNTSSKGGFSVAIFVFRGVFHNSGQISIIPKPELRGYWRDSLTKPPFKVTSAEVVIICPDNLLQNRHFRPFFSL